MTLAPVDLVKKDLKALIVIELVCNSLVEAPVFFPHENLLSFVLGAVTACKYIISQEGDAGNQKGGGAEQGADQRGGR